VFLILVLLGFGLRLGYGIARYRSDLIHLSGREFIAKWDFDALEHVLIARAILSGRGYVVDDLPGTESKHVRGVGQDAIFKAPLYQFFLAGLFALSGFSFVLFFPVQALLGGVLSGLVGLLTLETFQRPRAAWFAGIAAAAHPVLVNSASQPYNENLFFCLFVAALWTFTRWLRTRHVHWAITCGFLVALWVLTRESAVPQFLAMVIFGSLTLERRPEALRGLVLIVLVAISSILPWSVRNYLRFGVVVPVASIVGGAFVEGNNECAARESLFTPVFPEGRPCPGPETWEALEPRLRLEGRDNVAWRDRVNARLALRFIEAHPAAYLKLCLRRLWTVLLPYNPRADQRLLQRASFTLYWLPVIPAGLLGAALQLRSRRKGPALLGLLVLTNLLALAAVMVHSDLRFRVGIDLLLACFAGWGYDELSRRWAGARSSRSWRLRIPRMSWSAGSPAHRT